MFSILKQRILYDVYLSREHTSKYIIISFILILKFLGMPTEPGGSGTPCGSGDRDPHTAVTSRPLGHRREGED